MQNYQDYTTYLGVGIRLHAKNCQVIRKVRGVWQELGPIYDLPVDNRLLEWHPSTIPPGVLAVAVHVFEAEFGGTRLRRLLMMNDPQRRQILANQMLPSRRGETAA
jgi:hypothetical protein